MKKLTNLLLLGSLFFSGCTYTIKNYGLIRNWDDRKAAGNILFYDKNKDGKYDEIHAWLGKMPGQNSIWDLTKQMVLKYFIDKYGSKKGQELYLKLEFECKLTKIVSEIVNSIPNYYFPHNKNFACPGTHFSIGFSNFEKIINKYTK